MTDRNNLTKDQLTKLITEVLGERCPQHHDGCMTCAAWWMFDRISVEPACAHASLVLGDKGYQCAKCGHFNEWAPTHPMAADGWQTLDGKPVHCPTCQCPEIEKAGFINPYRPANTADAETSTESTANFHLNRGGVE